MPKIFISILSLMVAAVLLNSCAQKDAQAGDPLQMTRVAPVPAAASADASAGRKLFLKNCAHCHGADARGDEGPDLHHLDESDTWIANRIRTGKRGQMTAFAGKLRPEEIAMVIAYLRTLP